MFRWTRSGIEDRWHRNSVPGSHEWWGYEAVDREGELAVAVRIALGDPMDPIYAAKLRRGAAGEQARPDRNILVRMVAYRRQRRVLARTFRPGPETFAASPSSGAVRAGAASVEIEESADARTYRLRIDPDLDLEFRGPAGRPASTGPASTPVWDLASLGLEVRGSITVAGERLPFRGQGVHEHGFGPGPAQPSVRSWAWGWAHAWEFGVAWRQVVLESGGVQTVLVVDWNGEPFLGEEARSRPFRRRYSLLGVPYRRRWRLDSPSGAGLAIERLATLASSPLGMRFLTNIRLNVADPGGRMRLVDGIGLSSVARPCRVRVAPLRWLTLARDVWTSTPP